MSKQIDFLSLRASIETDEIFETLKQKYTEIEVDLLSWRNNPSCACGKRVFDFFSKIYQEDEGQAKFLDSLFQEEKVKEKARELTQAKRKVVTQQDIPQVPPEMTDYRGKIFTVGKSEEDWSNFWKKINEDRAAYRTFSLIDAGEYLKVYFL
jgi:hypothetical protein